MSRRGGGASKGAICQTPSEQIINVTCCNTGPINCARQEKASLCDSVFSPGGKQGGGQRGAGKGGAKGGARASGQKGGSNDCAVDAGQIIYESILTMWEEQKLCDVVLQANGDDLRAHKVAMAPHSEFLTEKFLSFPAGEVVSIDLSEFACQIVHSVVTYVYTGQVEMSNETVGPLLKCADELGICTLVLCCLEFLSNITIENAIMFYSIAENYNIQDLRDSALVFICENFSEIAMTKHFMYLPFERLICILNNDCVNIPSEIEVFCAVVSWIDFDRTQRICYAPRLLQCGVRMHCISPEQLICKVESVEWLFDIPECEYILNEAIRYHALQLSGSSLAPPGDHHRPRLANPASCFPRCK